VRQAARPASPPPVTNVQQAIGDALAELAPRAAADTAETATKSAPQLPAAWQALVDSQATSPAKAAPAALTPRASEAPLGLTDDVPFWGAPQAAENMAGSLRRALGAEDAGAVLGRSADDIRATAGGPSRRPMVAELADLDLNYMRRLADPRGQIDPQLLKLLARASIGGLYGGSGGSIDGAAKGALIGALANPKVVGNALFGAGKVAKHPNVFRGALLSMMNGDEQ
jgi:hypothetical protein